MSPHEEEDCPVNLLQYVNKPKQFRIHVCKELVIMNKDLTKIRKDVDWIKWISATVLVAIIGTGIKLLFF